MIKKVDVISWLGKAAEAFIDEMKPDRNPTLQFVSMASGCSAHFSNRSYADSYRHKYGPFLGTRTPIGPFLVYEDGDGIYTTDKSSLDHFETADGRKRVELNDPKLISFLFSIGLDAKEINGVLMHFNENGKRVYPFASYYETINSELEHMKNIPHDAGDKESYLANSWEKIANKAIKAGIKSGPDSMLFKSVVSQVGSNACYIALFGNKKLLAMVLDGIANAPVDKLEEELESVNKAIIAISDSLDTCKDPEGMNLTMITTLKNAYKTAVEKTGEAGSALPGFRSQMLRKNSAISSNDYIHYLERIRASASAANMLAASVIVDELEAASNMFDHILTLAEDEALKKKFGEDYYKQEVLKPLNDFVRQQRTEACIGTIATIRYIHSSKTNNDIFVLNAAFFRMNGMFKKYGVLDKLNPAMEWARKNLNNPAWIEF